MTDPKRPIVESITGEFVRYKALAEAALEQLKDGELGAPAPGSGNSIATVCWHVAGNLRSRFTDFLTSDGEKPSRKREAEFEARSVTRTELLTTWETGWSALFAALAGLGDTDLGRFVKIRGQDHRVDQALHRSLAHVSYHVGQIVYAARVLRGSAWRFLSIPPGQSDAFNASMPGQLPAEHLHWMGRQA